MFKTCHRALATTTLYMSVMILISCSSTPITSSKVVSRELATLPEALSLKKATPQPSGAIQTSVEPAPSPKTTLEPKLSDLSREWNVHPYELRKQATALEQFIRHGRFPRQYCSNGRALKPQANMLCAQVYQVVASYSKKKRPQPQQARSSGAPKKGQRFKITSQNLAWAQKQHFDDLISSITPMGTQQILDFTPQLLKHTSCPRNLSAAGIRKLENFLPRNDVKIAMEKLYAHASFCLRPSDAGHSLTHFRQALLRIVWGDHSRARAAASLAPLGAKGEELPRALFWAGLLQTDTALKNQYWSRLMNDHPLSFHALNAHRHLNSDPMANAVTRPLVNPSRDSNVAALSLSLKWFEVLMLSGKETGASRLAYWAANNFKDDLSLNNIIYITHLKADKSTHQSSFGFVWNQLNKNPENMNEQTLKLLFPIPYWETFRRAGGPNDPMLLVSVAKQESAFNPRARSPANARGLLQLLPTTAHALTGRNVNLYAPEINAQLGSKFLGNMIRKFDSVELALAAYNAGPRRIPSWQKRYPTNSSMVFIDLIPYRETRNYVANILRNNYWYSRLYEEAPFRAPENTKKSQSVLVASLLNGTKGANNSTSSNMTVAAATGGLSPQAR
jgi:soluble lytic murein transglycosylase